MVCLTLAGAGVLAFLGFFKYLLAADASYLGFTAITVFSVMTMFVGQLTYSAVRGKQFKQHLGFCWFVTEGLLGLGMIGTLVGFLILLSTAFVGVDLTNAANMQKTLGAMGSGFATSGLATLTGLACSLLLKLQLVNLEYKLEDET